MLQHALPAGYIAPCLATRLQARPRRHRVEAPWLALPLRPVAVLGQDEELGMCGGDARGGRGLGQI